MTKRMGAIYALDYDLTTYDEAGVPEVISEGTPVKVHMKYTLKNGLKRLLLRTPDRIGLDLSDEGAEDVLRAATRADRERYARMKAEFDKIEGGAS